LKLYDELDVLRKEVQDLKSNGDVARLKERDDELKAQKKALDSKTKLEHEQKDEQIKELQALISRSQEDYERK